MITRVRIKFDKMYGETSRAFYLYFNMLGRAEWFPKRLCKDFILNKKLGGNTVIPTWLYKEKFGCEPPEEDVDTIIEKHIPERIEPKVTEPNKELKR